MDRAPWPTLARSLVAELSTARGRVALVVGSPHDLSPMDPLARALGRPLVSVGRVLTEPDAPPTPSSVFRQLAEAELLDDVDILFAPELNLDPLALLRDLARRRPRVMRWPGEVYGRRATYSRPGRRDHYDRELSDAIVLRPRPTRFPDEAPYAVERIP